MRTRDGDLKSENKQLIAANIKLSNEVDHWKNLYLASVNKKIGVKFVGKK